MAFAAPVSSAGAGECEHLRDSVTQRPLSTSLSLSSSLSVDVGVVDGRGEGDGRRLQGVARRDGDGQGEDAPLIDGAVGALKGCEGE